MKTLLFLFIIFKGTFAFALEYSKIEFEGCPENAFCKKETGINRKKWIEELKNFAMGKISEQKINSYIQSEFGLPVSGWAQEEASLLPNILLWDSPCRQHSKATNKYYIAEVFRKNFHAHELKELPNLFFSRAILMSESNTPYAVVIPRGDAPLFFKDNQLYFLREEEGNFFGLLISKDGKFKVTKSESSAKAPKEIECTKEQIALFNRESPGPNFYQGTYCKEIWDTTNKIYRPVLLGWSCN